jgi:hypothetical protein
MAGRNEVRPIASIRSTRPLPERAGDEALLHRNSGFTSLFGSTQEKGSFRGKRSFGHATTRLPISKRSLPAASPGCHVRIHGSL